MYIIQEQYKNAQKFYKKNLKISQRLANINSLYEAVLGIEYYNYGMFMQKYLNDENGAKKLLIEAKRLLSQYEYVKEYYDMVVDILNQYF